MDSPKLVQLLAKKRVILLTEEIDPKLQREVCASVRALDHESHGRIELHIDSPGGAMVPVAFLIDAVRFAASQVRGVVVGRACSGAFMLLQACDERWAYPNARLMFHGFSGRFDVQHDHPTWKDYLEQAIEYHERFLAELHHRSGTKLSLLKKWSRLERYFTSQEALRFGFIDHIMKPPPKK